MSRSMLPPRRSCSTSRREREASSRPYGVDVLACAAGPIRTPNYLSSKEAGKGPKALEMEPGEVARQALAGLGRRTLVVPGALNKLALFFMGRILPRATAVRLIARSTRAMYGGGWMSGKITVVTGAAGHIGGNLVRALLAEGRAVRCLVRRDRRALEGLEVEMVEGDIFDPASLRRLMKGAGTVFHLAGRISIVGSEGGLVERTNVGGVRNIVEACRDCGVDRLVHMSSIHSFNTHPNDVMIDETRELALGPGAHAL